MVKVPSGKGKTPIGAVYLGAIFSDGGGIIIYPGHDGKLHVKVIPPREPVLGQLNTIAGLMALSEASSDPRIGRELGASAAKLLADNSSEIVSTLETLAAAP